MDTGKDTYMDTFYTRHLYAQQRYKVEDRLISVNETFQPDPRSVNLTWKFYSKYKDTCDSCKNYNRTNENGDRSQNEQENQPNSGCCDCNNAQSAPTTPNDNLYKYTELIASEMNKTPKQTYKNWREPPLTSMEYGWLPANMFTAHYDDADRQRFFRGRKKVNFFS